MPKSGHRRTFKRAHRITSAICLEMDDCGPIRVPREEFAAVCEICENDFQKAEG
jgi:hypothetical protein